MLRDWQGEVKAAGGVLRAWQGDLKVAGGGLRAWQGDLKAAGRVLRDLNASAWDECDACDEWDNDFKKFSSAKHYVFNM